MDKTTRSLKQAFRLAAAAALASATWASAADITLAAVSPSKEPSNPASVQDLGRIDVAASYDAQVRRELTRHARHPDKSKASPRKLNGKVDIDFEVNPDGSLKQAAITQSSSSNALDGAALRAVERARFQPVPLGAQPDGSARRYLVTFDYRYDHRN